MKNTGKASIFVSLPDNMQMTRKESNGAVKRNSVRNIPDALTGGEYCDEKK